ncbi:MAG TPA: class I SAM-dependent methyltransferase [Terriglobia bacterium]|nr:class I SAM-dependent methyltransferase [Terriglobia bacterium]
MLRRFAGLLLLGAFSGAVLPLANPVPAAGEHRSPAAGQREKRVYTNDDFPVATAPRAEDASSAAKAAAGTAGGERVAPFVPTPMEVVDRMLEMARTTSKDVVYDLGSGDGRIVLRAAEKFGARGVGVELEHRLAAESAETARQRKLDHQVRIIEGDLFQTDLTPASVVTVYLLLSTNDRLRPLLEKQLRPGARVVAHDLRIPGWMAAREETVYVGTVLHTVYLYEIPGAFEKRIPR